MKLDLFDKIGLGFISLFAGFILSNPISKELAIINSNNNLNKEKTAILVSYDNLLDGLLMNYAQGVGLTAYSFSKKGKIEIIDKAKKEDLERVLTDSTYKNIVIYGHGSGKSWWDSDGKHVSYKKLNSSSKERILQFTCGKRSNESLVNLYAKNKEESFCPERGARNGFHNYVYGLNLLLSQK